MLHSSLVTHFTLWQVDPKRQRLAAALLPILFWNKVPGHATRVPQVELTGNQLHPVLYHCQLGQNIPTYMIFAKLCCVKERDEEHHNFKDKQ